MATVDFEILVVGGGGGAGTFASGGGGGGGVLYSASTLIEEGSYPVTVGAGGVGHNNGSNSVFHTFTAIGGGRGGYDSGSGSAVGGNGGSGGGGGGAGSGGSAAGGTGTVGQGNNGGNGIVTIVGSNKAGGGGGGAGGNGNSQSSGNGGNGGNGLQYSISGTATYYGGGGGGAAKSSGGTPGSGGLGGGGNGAVSASGTAQNGTPNTGGGAGGGDASTARNGGSGIVIIRYATDPLIEATGGTITTSGGDTIHTFTSSGTFEFSIVPPSLPTVETDASPYVEKFGFTAQGEVTYIGGGASDVDERGFVFGLSSESDPGDTAPGSTAYDDFVSESGSFPAEIFTSPIPNLEPNTTYYIRAYAHNYLGYAYGAEVEVTTENYSPEILSVDPPGTLVDTAEDITILGSHFEDGLTVEIDGEACTSIVVVDENTITCTTPMSAVQKNAILVVTNPDAKQASASFFYMESVDPTPQPGSVTATFSVKGISAI